MRMMKVYSVASRVMEKEMDRRSLTIFCSIFEVSFVVRLSND